MELYNHFDYGLELTQRMKLFVPEKATDVIYYKAPNSDTLASISNRLSSIHFPVLVAIDGKDSDFDDNDSDQLLKKPQFFFMILKPARNDDPEDILDAQRICEANALQIQAKLMADCRNYEKGLTGLMLNTFTIRSIGPVGDNLYGVIVGFNIQHGVDYSVKEEYWKTV